MLAPAYSTPWTVSLTVNNNPGISSKSQHLCSGAIVDKLYVVTLAKCIKKISNGSRIKVEAPSDDGEGVFIDVPKQTRLVSDLFINVFSPFNDNVPDDKIVYLRLSHPIIFSNNIQPISYFPSIPQIKLPEGTVVYYYGWTEVKKRGMTFNAMTVRI